jgi:hypothetical protein
MAPGAISMSFLNDAKAAATMAIPGSGTPEAQRRVLDAMPIEELAGLWCSLQYLGMRDYTEEVWSNILYFDSLPHDAPERSFELVLAVLRSEAHKSVKMELNDKLMTTLVHAHAERLIDEIEARAHDHPQLRWLIGGAYWWAADDMLKARLAAVADEDAWRADDDARAAAGASIDFAALPLEQLALAWVAQKCKPRKDQDANWMVLCDYERELQQENPNKIIDLILAILRIESDPHVLSYLAAGTLEDVISTRTIDRIEREAAGNEDFRTLLRGAWYWNESHEIKRRLDAIIGVNDG